MWEGPTMKQDQLEEVKRILGEVLRERLQDIAFDSIDIRPDLDEYDHEILWVTVVFDDDEAEKLNADKTLGIIRRLRPRFAEEAGTEAFPVMSYAKKSEWEKLLDGTS